MSSHGQGQSGRAVRAGAVAAGAVAVAAACVWGYCRALGESGWLGRAVWSRLFVTHSVIVLAAGVLLLVIVLALARAGAAGRARGRGFRGDQEGTIMVEFALLLPIALMLVLIMAQSALLMVGNLCVHYAAFCAARSAIVYVPSWDDVEEPNVVWGDERSSYKLQVIRTAAVWAVMPVSCGSDLLPETGSVTLRSGLDDFFGHFGEAAPVWVHRHVGRKMYYADEYTSVWLDEPAGGWAYGQNEELNVHVRHTFYLSVPYANRLYTWLFSDHGQKLYFGPAEYGLNIFASCRLTNEGVRDYIEPEKYPPD